MCSCNQMEGSEQRSVRSQLGIYFASILALIAEDIFK